MQSWHRKLRRALHLLSKHSPEKALDVLRRAVEECPVTKTRDLSSLLFYTGITLKKLGCMDGAIQSWIGAHRLVKDSYSIKMIRRYVNCYGMEKQCTEETDDWMAFYSIQAARYLETKKTGRFSSDAERDMIRDLLSDHWGRIKSSLDGMSPQAKKHLFREVKIPFPFLVLDQDGEKNVIPVDFRHRRRIDAGERCPCGSGLSYLVCCGRIPRETGRTSGEF
jgi:hypothetical protein